MARPGRPDLTCPVHTDAFVLLALDSHTHAHTYKQFFYDDVSWGASHRMKILCNQPAVLQTSVQGILAGLLLMLVTERLRACLTSLGWPATVPLHSTMYARVLSMQR